MESSPLVTIVVLSYNNDRYTKECLDSIAKQTYANIQLIVTDDASRDLSKSVIADWEKENKLIDTALFNETNIGINRSLNNALSYAKGKYIAIIASDDYMHERRVQHQVDLFNGLDETYGLVYGDAYLIDASGNRIGATYLSSDFVPFEMSGNLYYSLLKKMFIPTMSVMYRKSLLQSIGCYDETLLFEDMDMWFRMSKKFLIKYDESCLTYRRLHGNNFHVTRFRTVALSESFFRIFIKHLDCSDDTRLLVKHQCYRNLLIMIQMRHIGHQTYKNYTRQYFNAFGIDRLLSIVVFNNLPFKLFLLLRLLVDTIKGRKYYKYDYEWM